MQQSTAQTHHVVPIRPREEVLLEVVECSVAQTYQTMKDAHNYTRCIPPRRRLVTEVLGQRFLGLESVFELCQHQLTVPSQQLRLYVVSSAPSGRLY